MENRPYLSVIEQSLHYFDRPHQQAATEPVVCPAAWRGEDMLADTRRGEKLPDGFIVDEQGNVAWIVEFAGAYDADRVRAVHQDCAQRVLPYQMW